MSKFAKWVKTIFGQNGSEDWAQMSSSIQKMAAASGINRRKNARILYPNDNFSARLPQIIYENQPQKAVDISLGGVCLLNDENQFGVKTGDSMVVAFRWMNEGDREVPAKIVGQSYNKVHLQFDDLPTDIFVKLSIQLKSGMVGRKFQQCFLNENESLYTEYSELWTGLNSEKLVFYNEGSYFAELNYFGTTTRFYKNKKPEVFDKNGQEVTFSNAQLSDSLILLTNIPSPSARVKELTGVLENFNTFYRGVG